MTIKKDYIYSIHACYSGTYSCIFINLSVFIYLEVQGKSSIRHLKRSSNVTQEDMEEQARRVMFFSCSSTSIRFSEKILNLILFFATIFKALSRTTNHGNLPIHIRIGGQRHRNALYQCSPKQ